MAIAVLLEEVARVKLGLREALRLPFLADRCQMRAASASPYNGFSNFNTTGTPRSSKHSSPGGGRMCALPSSSSNCPWRYAASARRIASL
eukprot:881023-Pleurochrysis_carterae.AAC.1